MRLSRDRRGQSVVIGTVLVFGFLVIGLSLYQVQVVPQQNAQTEFEHFESVQNDLVDLRAGILQAGSTDRTQYQTVRLGTSYSTRVFAINPPPPAGEIRTSDPYNITIDPENGDPINVSTRFVEYRPGYNEIDRSPTRYDASVLYTDARDNGGGIAVIEGQELVDNDGNVAIVAVQNEFQRSGTGRVTIELRPAESVTDDIPDGPLTVTIPTRLSETDWETKTNITEKDAYDGVTSDDNNDGIYNLTLDTTGENLTVDTVGVGEAPEEPTQNVNGAFNGGGSGPDGGHDEAEGDPLPSGVVAYDDANSNGVYDADETTYTASDLQSFDRAVNLVVARSTTVSSYDINADAITVDTGVTMENQFGSVSLTTNSGGDIGIRGTIDTTNNPGSSIGLDGGTVNIRDGSLLSSGSVSLSTSVGDITVDDATIDTTAGSGQSITFDAENGFSGVNAQITSSGSVSLSTSVGDITVDDATIDTTAASGQSVTFDAENGFSGVNAQITSSGSVSLTASIGGITVDDAMIDTTAGSGQSTTFDAQSGISGENTRITSSGSVSITSSDSITFNNALLDVTDGSNQAITLTTGDELSVEGTRLVGDQSSTFTGNRDSNGRSVFVNNAIFERGNGDAKEFDVSPGSSPGSSGNPPQNVNGNPQKGTVV